MTPQEQIARVRLLVLPTYESLTGPDGDILLAVCDLAERALLNDDEREAAKWFGDQPYSQKQGIRRYESKINAVLRRLLGES